MLRLTLELHLINPIDDSRFANFRKTDSEKRNQGLMQLIWFLLFLGATDEEISENLALYRQSRQNARASFLYGANPSYTRPYNLRGNEEVKSSNKNFQNFSDNTQHRTFGDTVVQDARARTIPHNH